CAARHAEHGTAEREHLDEVRSTRRWHSHTHPVSDTGFGLLFMQQATAVECTLYTVSGSAVPTGASGITVHGTCTSRDVSTATILRRNDDERRDAGDPTRGPEPVLCCPRREARRPACSPSGPGALA